MKNKRGITLVALVITIIILLILAGITITQLTNNGLFEKVKEAERKYENAQIKENMILNSYESYINNDRNSLNQEVILWSGCADETKEYLYTNTDYETTDFQYILVTYSAKNGSDRQSMLIHKSQIVLSNYDYRFQLTGYGTRYNCFYFNTKSFTISTISDPNYMSITAVIGIK